MNLKFWKKKEVKRELSCYSNIKIHLDSQMYISFNHKVDSDKYSIAPWKHFYIWYFCRDSENYAFKHKSGAYLIERKRIRLVEIYMTKVHHENNN